MENIKFGPDGWCSLIADQFTVGNIARAARAISRWLVGKHKENTPSVVIGYDTRFGGPMFAETMAKIFAVGGIKVFLSDRFATSPMVSLGTVRKKASMGIIISASNKAFMYSGIKLKGHFGGPLADTDLRNIENMVPEFSEVHLESIHFDEYIDKKIIEYIDLEELYINHVRNNIDLDLIARSDFSFAFDAMFGSGQQIMKKLLPGVRSLHCEQDFAFGGKSPEPDFSNLREFSTLIKKDGKLDCGLAVDGDACRAAMLDVNGNYVDANNIMLLLIHYLHKYKGHEGKVVAGFSATSMIEKLCGNYALPVRRVRSGFRDICNIMLKEKVLVGGEETGGISVISHIPDRDGIWAGLLIWQFMAETGKSLRELLDEVHDITGFFAFERVELAVEKNRKNAIIEKCRNGFFGRFGDRVVERVETLEGFKFLFTNGEWLLIRPSGAISGLKMYAESTSSESCLEILKDAREAVLGAVPLE